MSAQDFIVPAYQFAAASATAMLVSVLEKESEIKQIKKKTQSMSQYFHLSESGILLLKTISLT